MPACEPMIGQETLPCKPIRTQHSHKGEESSQLFPKWEGFLPEIQGRGQNGPCPPHSWDLDMTLLCWHLCVPRITPWAQ
jgi:hypothetical protein